MIRKNGWIDAIKRDDGSIVFINVSYIHKYYSEEFEYRISVSVLPKRKRNKIYINCTDDLEYRRLPYGSNKRDEYELKKLLEYVTIEEINEAELECWQKMKP